MPSSRRDKPRGRRKRRSSKRTADPEFELANGLRLLVKEDHRLPFVELRAVFKGGVLAETPENNGVTLVDGQNAVERHATRSAEEKLPRNRIGRRQH